MEFSMEERVRIVRAFYENGCSRKNAYRALRGYFGIRNRPSERTIYNIIQKFTQTGSVNNVKVLQRARRCRTDENIDRVRESVADEPLASIRRRSKQLGISHASIHRILTMDLAAQEDKEKIDEPPRLKVLEIPMKASKSAKDSKKTLNGKTAAEVVEVVMLDEETDEEEPNKNEDLSIEINPGTAEKMSNRRKRKADAKAKEPALVAKKVPKIKTKVAKMKANGCA